MKPRSKLFAIALNQLLQSSNRFMSQSTLGSSLKKSSLLLSAVVTLGLVASPAKADPMQSAEIVGATTVPMTTVSVNEIAADEVMVEDNTIEPTTALMTAVEGTVTEGTVTEDTVAEDTVTEDTVAEDTVTEDTVTEDTVAEETTTVTVEPVSTEAIVSVSSDDLVNESVAAPRAQSASIETAQSPTTPDTTDITPGRTTRSSSSYIGIGGNIGIGDNDTGVGESSFAVFSKVGLTSNISARPAVLFSDDVTILVPLTLDFAFGDTEPSEDVSEDIGLRLNPYIGAGVAISTGGDGSVDFLATGGLDVPISSRFTGTAAVNAVFFDNIALGLLLGVGYNF